MSFLHEVRLEAEFGPLEEGGISRVQKGRILLSVEAARHDTYCVALDSWVVEARAGDLDASEVLGRRHGQMIYRVLVVILGNRSEPSTFPEVPNLTPPVGSAQ